MGIDRGQSSVIAVVLLLAITITAITVTLAVGTGALSFSKERADLNRVEHAMTQFDSRASLVALGGQESQRAAIPTGSPGSDLYVADGAGWMNVTAVNGTSGTVETVIMNTTLGALVYERGGTTIAYQGGGVWRKGASNGSAMVSPPEFHYRTSAGNRPTLTLPLVVVDEGTVAGSTDVVVRENGTDAKYPVTGNANRTNPLSGGEVTVTVHSEYYEAWGRFFEERTGGSVTYDHDRQTAGITLVVPSAETEGVAGGIVTGGTAGGTLTIQNQGEADSYNSSEGAYAATAAENTDIVTGNDVKIENQGTIFGDVESGGSVVMEGKAEVTGNVSYGGTLSKDAQATIGGEARNDANVTVPDPVDGLIDDKRAAFDASNDNANTSAVDDATNRLTGCGSTCELGAGEYLLDRIQLGNGDELLLNTTGGPVEVVVRNGVSFQGDTKVRVIGNGSARFYLERDMTIQNQANLSVPGDRSTGLWFYMNPGSQANFGNSARFVGVVFGPGSGAQAGVDVGLSNQVDIFGGLVGKVDSVQNNIGLHFDEALATSNPLDGTGAGGGGGSSTPDLTYLHVSVNRVNVTR